MKLDTVPEMWESFKAAVFDKEEEYSAVQLQETRRAFMAGAWGMFCACRSIGEGIPDDEAFAYLEQCERDMRAFHEALKRGEA